MKQLILAVLLLWSSLATYAVDHPETAAKDLIKRVLPKHANAFTVSIAADKNNTDYFELESRDGKILLRGNNGISIASALKYYLQHYAHCDISWNGTNLRLPAQLPPVPVKVHRNTPYEYRYYLNYCTFNYTMSWWTWERWQWEIDWMAMNGINAPLALTGQNSIWDRVYKSLGFADQELANFYSGPAYFNWFWMGNFDAYNGPLPQSFMQQHEALQHKILARERALGMKPILPAFTGHVPPAFKDKFPQAKVHKTNSGGGFADSYILDPNDPKFLQVGNAFTSALINTYGTDHIYSADTFNENTPPSSDSLYLHDISKRVYESMAAVDSAATWVMQGWLFHISANFWQPTQTKAILNAVPDGKLIILDLYAETNPIWQKTNAFYGKPWIWCMLHNFGGNISLFGRMDAAAKDPALALNNPASGKMKGIGLTPEGIEQNPVMYALMLENVWRDTPIEVEQWLKTYAHNRYGKINPHAEKAWEVLQRTVYNGGKTEGGAESIITGRPTFNTSTPWAKTQLSYDAKELLPAWQEMMLASKALGNSDGFQYDLADITRQVMANYANVLQQQIAQSYQQNNRVRFKQESRQFLQLISDMDRLLSTRKDFLLGRWLQDAKNMGTTPAEKALYEKNARNLLTLWGDKNSPLYDYANRQWAGLLNGFYKPRWELFFAYVDKCLENGEQVEEEVIHQQLKNMEWQWVESHDIYPAQTTGNTITMATALYNKYQQIITAAYP
jgi:alpha-N-acetylglucosaminidase